MPRPRKPDFEKTYVISIRVPYRLREKWRELTTLARQKGLKQWQLFEKMLEAGEKWLKYEIPP